MPGGERDGRKRHASALSLDAFAKAKKSAYDPRDVKEKEREHASRAIRKYNKIKRRVAGAQPAVVRLENGGSNAQTAGQEGQALAHTGREASKQRRGEAIPSADDRPQRKAKPLDLEGGQRKPVSSLQRLAADTQTQKEAERQAREEQQRQAAERRAKLQQEAKVRQQQSKLYRKKTQHGQPVMKHRIEKMLQKLQGS